MRLLSKGSEQKLPSSVQVDRLVIRLRDLEAEALRLAETTVPPDLETLQLYQERLDRLASSHSRSWFGDHASTYYRGFRLPAGGHSFNVEWGLLDGFEGSYNPDWQTYSRDELRSFIFERIGEKIFHSINSLANQTIEQFSSVRDQAIDVLEVLSNKVPSKAITRYTGSLENEIKPYHVVEYINRCAKNTPSMTRDSAEIAKGNNVPVHVQYLAPIQSLEINRRRLGELAGTIRKVIELVNLVSDGNESAVQSSAIFIGHGRSEQWRVLKDFLKERLNLSFEEFNRISVAGIGTQERLAEMLGNCGFAFLVLTAEDLHSNDTLHARENVIHEAGLFQGRLGWRRAIVLLEDGCEEFSNIVGLGQIRFSKGNITSCFEDIRRVLERENLLLSR